MEILIVPYFPHKSTQQTQSRQIYNQAHILGPECIHLATSHPIAHGWFHLISNLILHLVAAMMGHMEVDVCACLCV